MTELNLKITHNARILVPINNSPLYMIVDPNDEIFYSSELKAHYHGTTYDLKWKTPAIFSRRGMYIFIPGRQDKDKLEGAFVPWRNIRTIDETRLKIFLGKNNPYNFTTYRQTIIQGVETNEEFRKRIENFNKIAYQHIIKDHRDYIKYLIKHKDNKNVYKSKYEKKARKLLAIAEERYAELLKRSI
ncbi:MAG: hypothetical protein JW891_13345 [Candidatus Lokiarchaeota archaeon]|nr:hypothetical protein [Candidatus Lokiarchaeota archaeon]